MAAACLTSCARPSASRSHRLVHEVVWVALDGMGGDGMGWMGLGWQGRAWGGVGGNGVGQVLHMCFMHRMLRSLVCT